MKKNLAASLAIFINLKLNDYMAKDPIAKQFIKTKKEVSDNLAAIKYLLEECIDAGMLDIDDRFYNEINDFLNQTALTKEFPQLIEVITQARLLEQDIDVFLAEKGRSTLSLSWPAIPKESL